MEKEVPRVSYILIFLWILSSFTLIRPASALIQASNLTGNPSRASVIKAAYLDSYHEYVKYSCHGGECGDELNPLSETNSSPFGDWGATLVDALSTHHLMGLDDEYDKGVKLTERINFKHTSQSEISLFETNIRFVGGLMSAYELGGKTNQKLIDQAKIVGDHLLSGWVGDNDLPFNTLLNWDNFGPPNVSTGAIIAETGTLVLERYKLSKYTGDPTYADHADRAMKTTSQIKSPFPGLKAQGVDPMTNEPTDDYVTFGGGSDSYFEYLIKYGILLGSTQTWIPEWIKAIDSAITHLITKAYKPPELTYLTDYSESNGGNIYQFGHLGCYVGGNWMLGGKVLNRPDILEYGLNLTKSCVNTYTSSATGLGPEFFSFIGEGNKRNGVKITDQAFYDEHGFNYEVVSYVLRPEVMESVFYAYRITGDPMWQDVAWEAFKNLRKYCKAKQGATAAYVAIPEVNNTQTGQYDNSQSFLYAELFKYLYLIQADPSVASLDEYVFTTEGHPLLIEKPGADLTSAKGDDVEKGSTQVTHIPTMTGKKIDLPFFSGLPGVSQDISAPRLISKVVAGVQKALEDVVSLLDTLLKGKGKGKGSNQKRASALGHGQGGKLAAKRKQSVLGL